MRLLRFEPYDGSATFTFPVYDISIADGRAEARSNFQMTPRGGFDPHGNDNAVHRPFDIVVDFDQIETDSVSLQTAKDATKAVFSKRGKLYAEPYNVGTEPTWQRTERWIDARCVVTPFERLIENYHFQPMALVFEVERLPWHGLPRPKWQFDESYSESTLTTYNAIFDATLFWDAGGFTNPLITSPHTQQAHLTVNNGNAAVTDISLVLVAGGADVTDLEIESDSGAHLVFNGTILAGTTLVIDTHNLTVEIDGVNAYNTADFGFGPNHAIADWFVMKPGANAVTVRWTGGTDDLITNGGFEDGFSGGLGVGWTKNGTPEIVEENIDQRTGAKAQSIRIVDSAAESLQQSFTVAVGDSLKVTIWSKRIFGTGDLVVNTASTAAQTSTPGIGSYAEFTYTWTATTTSEYIQIYSTDATTRILLDDIQVVRNGYPYFGMHYDDGWA